VAGSAAGQRMPTRSRCTALHRAVLHRAPPSPGRLAPSPPPAELAARCLGWQLTLRLASSVGVPSTPPSSGSYVVPATPSVRSVLPPPGTTSSEAAIWFVVRVPVLSEQMTVVQPSVSTLGSRRTIALRFAILRVPSARQVVMTAGRPSGIAATASATATCGTGAAGRCLGQPAAWRSAAALPMPLPPAHAGAHFCSGGGRCRKLSCLPPGATKPRP
jgi:hypothetical protein